MLDTSLSYPQTTSSCKYLSAHSYDSSRWYRRCTDSQNLQVWTRRFSLQHVAGLEEEKDVPPRCVQDAHRSSPVSLRHPWKDFMQFWNNLLNRLELELWVDNPILGNELLSVFIAVFCFDMLSGLLVCEYISSVNT